MTIVESLNSAEAKLAAAGVETPRLDAEVLLAHLLQRPRAQLLLDRREALDEGTRERFDALIAQRADRIPVAQIKGSKEFWSRPIEVTPDVLVPRPETETLVEEALKLIPDRNALLAILDLCTGSGCIAAALASELRNAAITATDASAAALQVASRNLAFAAGRATLLAGDLFSALPEGASFDLICSNPPYIAEGQRGDLAPEIIRHEPHAALFAGESGLDFIWRIMEDAPRFLRPGGWLLIEVGAGHSAACCSQATGIEGYDTVKTARDLAGIERVLLLRRSRFA